MLSLFRRGSGGRGLLFCGEGSLAHSLPVFACGADETAPTICTMVVEFPLEVEEALFQEFDLGFVALRPVLVSLGSCVMCDVDNGQWTGLCAFWLCGDWEGESNFVRMKILASSCCFSRRMHLFSPPLFLSVYLSPGTCHACKCLSRSVSPRWLLSPTLSTGVGLLILCA